MIRVLRTNQMPLFLLPHPVISRVESSGSYLGMDFVTNISAGYGDSDQGVSFEVEEIYNSTNMFSSSKVSYSLTTFGWSSIFMMLTSSRSESNWSARILHKSIVFIA